MTELVPGRPSRYLPPKGLGRRWIGIWPAFVVALLLAGGPARADIISDSWEGLKGAAKGAGELGESLLPPLDIANLITPKGCNFKIVSGHDFGSQASYKFVGSCRYGEEDKNGKKWDNIYDLEVEGLWSGKLTSELVLGRKGGKTALGAQMSYACPANPWKTGQSCQKTACAATTTKGCEGLSSILNHAGHKDQPITRKVGSVTAQFLGIKITAPNEGEIAYDNKPLGVTIVVPFGQKVQYELTSPGGPAHSQILGPVSGWGKLEDKTYVVASVPPGKLKPAGQWTMTAHLIGLDSAVLTKQGVHFKVVHAPGSIGTQGPSATGPLQATDPKTLPPGGGAGRGSPGASPRTSSVPPVGAVTPLPGARSATPGSLQVVLTQQQSPSSLLVALRNSHGTAEVPAQPVELRLGGRAIGQGRVPALGPGQENRLALRFQLPPGTTGPVDVEVWVGGSRLGSAKLTQITRTP